MVFRSDHFFRKRAVAEKMTTFKIPYENISITMGAFGNMIFLHGILRVANFFQKKRFAEKMTILKILFKKYL